jgi:hypothetical protein
MEMELLLLRSNRLAAQGCNFNNRDNNSKGLKDAILTLSKMIQMAIWLINYSSGDKQEMSLSSSLMGHNNHK